MLTHNSTRNENLHSPVSNCQNECVNDATAPERARKLLLSIDEILGLGYDVMALLGHVCCRTSTDVTFIAAADLSFEGDGGGGGGGEGRPLVLKLTGFMVSSSSGLWSSEYVVGVKG